MLVLTGSQVLEPRLRAHLHPSPGFLPLPQPRLEPHLQTGAPGFTGRSCRLLGTLALTAEGDLLLPGSDIHSPSFNPSATKPTLSLGTHCLPSRTCLGLREIVLTATEAHRSLLHTRSRAEPHKRAARGASESYTLLQLQPAFVLCHVHQTLLPHVSTQSSKLPVSWLCLVAVIHQQCRHLTATNPFR